MWVTSAPGGVGRPKNRDDRGVADAPMRYGGTLGRSEPTPPTSGPEGMVRAPSGTVPGDTPGTRRSPSSVFPATIQGVCTDAQVGPEFGRPGPGRQPRLGR